MANTVFQHKRSGTPASVPSVLEFGELAINYADGLIFYKNATSHIVSISGGGGGNAFGTINANGTLVVSDTAGDVLNLVSGNNITIVGDVVNDKITIGLKDTISISGDANVGKLYIAAAGGDEGGELRLDKPPNGTLAGGVVIDAYQNKIRIFEDNGTNRGVYIDLSSASASVGTDLLASSGSTDNVARSTAVAAFAAANASFLAANSAFANGNTTHTLAITSFAAANASFANSNTNFTTLQTVFGVANAGFLAANSAFANGNTTFTTLQTVFGAANASFANGNTNFTTLQTVFGQANTARNHANSAFANANSTHTLTIASFAAANASYANANTTHTLTIAAFSAANASFANGNTNFTTLQTVFGAANAAFSNANTTHTLAIAAFTQANTANNLTVANTGTVVGSRNVLNFIPGGNVTISFADDAAGNRVNVTIAATGSSGGGGGGLSYTSNVGNAVANTFNITHALNSTTIIPAVREISTGYYVYPDMKVTSPNNIVLEFVSVPTANQYFLVVLGV
jgi:hypothetical protein